MILGCVCHSPSDTMSLIYYTLSLLAYDFIVYNCIQDPTKKYVQRLINRIENSSAANNAKNRIETLRDIFYTWFLVNEKPLLQHTFVDEEGKTSYGNNTMVGKTISVSIKAKRWLLFQVKSTTELYPSLIVKLNKNIGDMQHIKSVALHMCMQVRAIRTSFSSYQLIIPHIEYMKQMQLYSKERKTAAMVIQRSYKAMLRNKRKCTHDTQKRILGQQKTLLIEKLLYRDSIRQRRHELVSKVKASFIGHRTRVKIETLHTAAIQCQKIIRGMLGKLKFEERKNWELYGAQIITMFERGRCVSGTFLLLQVYRSGYNYLIRGNDYEYGCTYQGLIRDEHVRALVRCHPYGRDSLYSPNQAPKLRIWHYNRITALLIKCLSLTVPIHGLGELNEFDGTKVMICDIEMKAKAHGPSILSRAGLSRILFDTKHIVFPPEGSKAWKQRKKQRLLMEKRNRAKTAPSKGEKKRKDKISKRPQTTI